MRLLLSWLALTAVVWAAGPEKTVEVRLEGKSFGVSTGALKVDLPASFTYSLKGTSTLESWSADERVSLKITVMPVPQKLAPKTKQQLEDFMRTSTERFAQESVEGKAIPFALNQANGLGVAATYTDKSEVGKPTPKGREHYKLLTSAFVRVGEAFAIATLLSDDANSPDHKAALKAIEGLRVAK
jgi:hypothetical protein